MMKRILAFIFFAYPFIAVGQGNIVDTNKVSHVVQPSDSIFKKRDPLYVLDGVPITSEEFKVLHPEDLLETTVLKYDATSLIICTPNSNGVVLIVTKKGAKTAYQKKLSLLSKKYQHYINENNGTDDKAIYILNGLPLEDDFLKSRTLKLYQINAKDIKNISIKIISDHDHNIINIPYVSIITTKSSSTARLY